MYPDDYKSDFNTISEEHIGDCIYAHLQGKKYAYECACCGSSNIKAKGFRTKKAFRDITVSKEAVYLTIEIPRYFCKDCDAKLKAAGVKSGELEENGKTIQSTYSVDCLPQCVPTDGKISASVVDEIIGLIAEQHLTVAEAAENMQVAPSSASKAIQKRRLKAEKTMAFQPPDCFVVYPFNYVKPERCALIGTWGNKKMLYGLLEDCKEQTIAAFLNGKDTRDGKPWSVPLVLTDFPRPDEHRMLEERYKDAPVGILRECVLDRVAKMRKKSYGRKLLAIIDDALADLEQILETHVYDHFSGEYIPFKRASTWSEDDIWDDVDYDELALKSFELMFQMWWEKLPNAAQSRLKGFYSDITDQYEKIVVGFTQLELEHNPSQLLRFIGICKARHIPFDELTGWLALVAGVHSRENISAVQMLSSSFVSQPINDFYIDLDEVNDLFDKEFST